jgi:hypothetical protein
VTTAPTPPTFAAPLPEAEGAPGAPVAVTDADVRPDTDSGFSPAAEYVHVTWVGSLWTQPVGSGVVACADWSGAPSRTTTGALTAMSDRIRRI